MKVSVIIPIFNAIPYLEQCLDSVAFQTFCDFEAIMVDDGSTDGSGVICDKYLLRDSRFKVVHQENGGSVLARKTGCDIAQGEYLAFIDADDWWEKDHLEHLYNGAKQIDADIVQCGMFYNNLEEEKWCNCQLNRSLRQVIIDCLSGKVHAGVVRKLIKRSFYEKSVNKLPPCDFYEDMFITISLFMHNPVYTSIPYVTYHYRYNGNSMTNDINVKKRCKMYRQFIENMSELDRLYFFTKDNDYRKAFFHIINSNKRHVIFSAISRPECLKPLLLYYRNSYSIREIHNKLDAFYWVASRFGILWPWKYRSLLKFI